MIIISDDNASSLLFAPTVAFPAAQVAVDIATAALGGRIMRKILIGIYHILPQMRPWMRFHQDILNHERQWKYHMFKKQFPKNMKLLKMNGHSKWT